MGEEGLHVARYNYSQENKKAEEGRKKRAPEKHSRELGGDDGALVNGGLGQHPQGLTGAGAGVVEVQVPHIL
jgi:hypothetical protein